MLLQFNGTSNTIVVKYITFIKYVLNRRNCKILTLIISFHIHNTLYRRYYNYSHFIDKNIDNIEVWSFLWVVEPESDINLLLFFDRYKVLNLFPIVAILLFLWGVKFYCVTHKPVAVDCFLTSYARSLDELFMDQMIWILIILHLLPIPSKFSNEWA